MAESPEPPVTADAAPLSDIRPSGAAYRRYLVAGLPIAAILLVVTLIRARHFLVLGIVLLVVALGIGFGLLWLYLRRARASSSGGELTRWNLWGAEAVRVPLDRIGETFLGVVAGGVQPVWQLLVVDRDGRKLLRINGGLYDSIEMARFADSLPGEKLLAEGIVSPALLRERYPHAVSWAEAHPIALALIIVGGIVLVSVVAVVVGMLASSGSM